MLIIIVESCIATFILINLIYLHTSLDSTILIHDCYLIVLVIIL